VAEGIRSIVKFNDIIENRTRYHPDCSLVNYSTFPFGVNTIYRRNEAIKAENFVFNNMFQKIIQIV
jgi:hypothetical protein